MTMYMPLTCYSPFSELFAGIYMMGLSQLGQVHMAHQRSPSQPDELAQRWSCMPLAVLSTSCFKKHNTFSRYYAGVELAWLSAHLTPSMPALPTRPAIVPSSSFHHMEPSATWETGWQFYQRQMREKTIQQQLLILRPAHHHESLTRWYRTVNFHGGSQVFHLRLLPRTNLETP